MSEDQATNRVSPISGVAPPAAHRFRPGTSGNPGGRPKGRSLVALLRERLTGPALGPRGKPGPEGMTLGDQVVEALAIAAASGDVKAIKELLDRTEGRARQAAPEHGDVEARDAWGAVCEEVEGEFADPGPEGTGDAPGPPGGVQ